MSYNQYTNQNSLTNGTFLKNGLLKFDVKKRVFGKFSANETTPNLMRGGVPLYFSEREKSVYVDYSDSHTLVIGATGSKKSRLFVMPLVKILGEAGESMIVSDPKGEVHDRTAGELEKLGYQVQVVNFRDLKKSASWNPLHIPYTCYLAGDIDRAYEYANDITENIMKAQVSVKDPYWDNAAADLCYGLILLLFKYCKEQKKPRNTVTMENVLRLRRILFAGLQGDRAKEDISEDLWDYAKSDEIIYAAVSGTYLNAPVTRNCILSVFDSKMRCFSLQQNLLDMMSSMSLDLDMIAHDISENEKTAIFLIMPDEKSGFNSLISLFIKQSYEYILQKIQNDNHDDVKSLSRRLNYILDEFSSLPKINDFSSMITAARSRNIRFNLVIQSKNQLVHNYDTEAETIRSNCMNWVFLTSRELDLLKEISTLCGEKSNGKPLISIAQLQRFDKTKGETLVLSGRKQPCIVQLPDIDYYDNKQYKKRYIEDRELTLKLEPLTFEFATNDNNQILEGDLHKFVKEHPINDKDKCYHELIENRRANDEIVDKLNKINIKKEDNDTEDDDDN